VVRAIRRGMTEFTLPYPAQTARAPTMAGLAVLLALAAGLAGWATFIPLSTALVLQGTIAPEQPARKLAHQTGGQVAQVLVRDGDSVQTGAPLIRLDTAELRSKAGVLEARLTEIAIRQARLRAEQAGMTRIAFPAGLPDSPRLGQERRIFALRAAERRAGRASLLRQIAALSGEIAGYGSQHAALLRQKSRLDGELAILRQLQRRGLVQSTRVLALNQTAAELDSDLGGLSARLADTRGRLDEARRRLARVGAPERTDAATRLADLNLNAAETSAQLAALEAEIAAATITAPFAGRVSELEVTGPGTALRPGAPALSFIPSNATPRANAYLAPADLARIAPGRQVRVTAVSTNPAPGAEFDGRIVSIGAVPVPINGSERRGYLVEVSLEIPADWLSPSWGQPVRVVVPGPSHTLTSFLLAPVRRAMAPAFRPP